MSLSTYCIGHITTGSFMGRGKQYIHLVKVLYCKLLTNSKQPPAFPLEVGPETKPQEARVLPLCHHGPQMVGYIHRSKLGLYWIQACRTPTDCFELSAP